MALYCDSMPVFCPNLSTIWNLHGLDPCSAQRPCAPGVNLKAENEGKHKLILRLKRPMRRPADATFDQAAGTIRKTKTEQIARSEFGDA